MYSPVYVIGIDGSGSIYLISCLRWLADMVVSDYRLDILLSTHPSPPNSTPSVNSSWSRSWYSLPTLSKYRMQCTVTDNRYEDDIVDFRMRWIKQLCYRNAQNQKKSNIDGDGCLWPRRLVSIADDMKSRRRTPRSEKLAETGQEKWQI